MIEFVAALPFQAGWFTIILFMCVLTCWYAYGIRSLFSWQAAVALVLFFIGVAASNAWQMVPRPTGELAADPEVQRIWFIKANEAVHQAKMWVRNLAIGFALVLAMRFPNKAPTLTFLILFVWFGAEVGESIERMVCKANDPAFGKEHEWLAENKPRPTCGRAFGGYGPLIFPLLTVTPLPFILWNTRRKFRQAKGRPV